MPFGGLLTIGLISAGTGLIGAKMQSSAAKNAAKTQAESGDKAIELQREVYEQGRADSAPWRHQGGQAVQTLGALMGMPGMPAQAQAQAPAAAPQAQPNGLTPALAQRAALRGVNVPAGWTPPAGAQTLGAIGQGATASSYVAMRAPDGSEQQVPAAMADHYTRLGAQRIG